MKRSKKSSSSKKPAAFRTRSTSKRSNLNKRPGLTRSDLNERPGMNFWLTQPYAIKGCRDGQVVPYEVVEAKVNRAGIPMIKIRALEIISAKGKVRVQSYAKSHPAAPIITVKPHPDYMYRKDGGAVDSRGNHYDLTHRPFMAIGGQFINLD